VRTWRSPVRCARPWGHPAASAGPRSTSRRPRVRRQDRITPRGREESRTLRRAASSSTCRCRGSRRQARLDRERAHRAPLRNSDTRRDTTTAQRCTRLCRTERATHIRHRGSSSRRAEDFSSRTTFAAAAETSTLARQSARGPRSLGAAVACAAGALLPNHGPRAARHWRRHWCHRVCRAMTDRVPPPPLPCRSPGVEASAPGPPVTGARPRRRLGVAGRAHSRPLGRPDTRPSSPVPSVCATSPAGRRKP
jgi:hypothetical protein